MLDVKPGVQPPMLFIAAAAARVAAKLGRSLTITSGIDGRHSPNSLHYSLRALDFRTYDVQDKAQLVALFRTELGPQYDVVLESDHLHVEFDPR